MRPLLQNKSLNYNAGAPVCSTPSHRIDNYLGSYTSLFRALCSFMFIYFPEVQINAFYVYLCMYALLAVPKFIKLVRCCVPSLGTYCVHWLLKFSHALGTGGWGTGGQAPRVVSAVRSCVNTLIHKTMKTLAHCKNQFFKILDINRWLTLV